MIAIWPLVAYIAKRDHAEIAPWLAIASDVVRIGRRIGTTASAWQALDRLHMIPCPMRFLGGLLAALFGTDRRYGLAGLLFGLLQFLPDWAAP